MAAEFDHLITSIESINWDSNSEAVSEAAELLRVIGAERLLRIAEPAVQRVLDSEVHEFNTFGSSRSIKETPTHLKFLLSGGSTEGAKLWLHMWGSRHPKPADPCYTEKPHNHCDELAAGPVKNGYQMRTWRSTPQPQRLAANRLWTPDAETWAHPEDRFYGPGETWALGTSDIHSIAATSGTISVTIKGPVLHDESYTFDEATGQVERPILNKAAALNDFLNSLAGKAVAAQG